MAKIRLKKNADPLGVAAALSKIGVTLHRRTTDGAYVIYVNKRHYAQFAAWADSLMKGGGDERDNTEAILSHQKGCR